MQTKNIIGKAGIANTTLAAYQARQTLRLYLTPQKLGRMTDDAVLAEYARFEAAARVQNQASVDRVVAGIRDAVRGE